MPNSQRERYMKKFEKDQIFGKSVEAMEKEEMNRDERRKERCVRVF